MRAIIYLIAGAGVFVAASLGAFRSVELFPWIFGFTWAIVGLVRVAFKRRAMARAHIALMLAGCVLAALAPAAHMVQGRVRRAAWEREALARFNTSGTPPLQFAHVVNNDSKTWRAGSYDGITVLNFWATWCSPCMSEMPLLSAFAAGHNPATVRVIGFTRFYDADDEPGRMKELAKIEQAMRTKGATFPSLVADGEKTHGDYYVEALPTTVLIAGGRIVAVGVAGSGTKRVLDIADRMAGMKEKR
jgi:thiol-disulfide isomerase/thioredoxin